MNCDPGQSLLIPEQIGPGPSAWMDLNMLVMLGGKERTAAGYEALLARDYLYQWLKNQSVTCVGALLIHWWPATLSSTNFTSMPLLFSLVS